MEGQMFSFLTKIIEKKYPLKSLDEVRRDLATERDAAGMAIAARYTRGNIAIQLGRAVRAAVSGGGALHPRIKAYLKQ